MDDHHEIGPQKENDRKSSTGLEENVAGLLCYLGTFVTGIIFFILEKEKPFCKISCNAVNGPLCNSVDCRDRR